MTNFRETHNRHVRLSMLRFLADDPDYRLNASLLGDALDDVGLGISRDQVVSQLEWLDEQGLVTLDKQSKWIVVTLTERGHDVARGRIAVEGVQRPRPGN